MLSSFHHLCALVLRFSLNITLSYVAKASPKFLLFFSLLANVALQVTPPEACSPIFKVGCFSTELVGSLRVSDTCLLAGGVNCRGFHLLLLSLSGWGVALLWLWCRTLSHFPLVPTLLGSY